MSVERVEPDIGLNREVFIDGDERIEEEEVYLFCHEASDDGLDLPVQDVDDFLLLGLFCYGGLHLDNGFDILKELIV